MYRGSTQLVLLVFVFAMIAGSAASGERGPLPGSDRRSSSSGQSLPPPTPTAPPSDLPPTQVPPTQVPPTAQVVPVPPVPESGPANKELVVDLRKGPTRKKDQELARLKAVVFAINSINTSTTELLTVDDLLKASFRGGKIPTNGEAKVKIDLSKFLKEAQIRKLNTLLSEDPFSCNGEKDLESGVRADSIVKNIFDPQNYTDLLGLNDRRNNFERDVGASREFDGLEEDRDKTKNTLRLILAPGDSGVVHDSAFRKIVAQKQSGPGREGLLLIRTEDTEKQNATKKDHNFAERPIGAKGDAHEEIWELPNGMRAYALRLRNGTLQRAAPPTLVTAKIINPISCMQCHTTGFVATTGEARSKTHDELTKVDLNLNERGFERGLAKDQYSATPKDYQGVISIANKRLEVALDKSGAGSPGDFAKFYGSVNDGSYRIDELANEFGVEPSRIGAVIAGDKSFKNVVNVPEIVRSLKDFAKQKDAEKLANVSRTDLEREVRVGRDSLSLYCVLKQRLVGIEEARLRRRGGFDRVHRGDERI